MTKWHYEVFIKEPEDHARSGVLASCDTLSLAISEAMSSAIYYQALYPTAQVWIGDLHEFCPTCNNQGEIDKKGPRSTKIIKCPDCKGKCPTGKADRIVLKLPDPANGIVLAFLKYKEHAEKLLASLSNEDRLDIMKKYQ
jgi:hypothetical protein